MQEKSPAGAQRCRKWIAGAAAAAVAAAAVAGLGD